MIVRINPELSEVIRQWTASAIKAHQPRLCCEVHVQDAEAATAMTLAVVESWKTGVFAVRTNSNGELLVDVDGLRDIAREEFPKEGTLSVLRVEGVGGCTFDFSIGETGDDSGEFLAAAWGDVEDSVEVISRIDGRAEVFRGN